MKKTVVLGVLLSLFFLFSVYFLYYQPSSKRENFQKCVHDIALVREFCRNVSKNEAAFCNFKRSFVYALFFEHATYEEGEKYLAIIKEHSPKLLEHFSRFLENEKVGNPELFEYRGVGSASPSTLRYIKVASDLDRYFGNLNGKRIVEIGGGHGGQCAILSSLYHLERYVIVDLPEVLDLAKKYLSEMQVNNVDFLSFEEFSKLPETDLIISNYTFTELDRKIQRSYLKEIFPKVKKGYLTCNFCFKHFGVDPLQKRELLEQFQQNNLAVEQFPEEPQTGNENFILSWKEENGYDKKENF